LLIKQTARSRRSPLDEIILGPSRDAAAEAVTGSTPTTMSSDMGPQRSDATAAAAGKRAGADFEDSSAVAKRGTKAEPAGAEKKDKEVPSFQNQVQTELAPCRLQVCGVVWKPGMPWGRWTIKFDPTTGIVKIACGDACFACMLAYVQGGLEKAKPPVTWIAHADKCNSCPKYTLDSTRYQLWDVHNSQALVGYMCI
jgi:hypothetical protein